MSLRISAVLKIFIALASLTMAPLANAHHSHASLDLETLIIWEGKVTEFSWRAPHVYIKATAPNTKGEVVEYTIEAGSPPAMARLGWDKNTFAEGDFIRWEGNPDRDPDRPYAGIEWAENQAGDYLPVSLKAAKSPRAQKVEMGSIEPAERIGEGRWWRIGADGKKFENIYGPPDDWPLSEKGLESVANFSEDDNPITQCILGGPPRNIISLLGFQWSRPDDDTIIIDRDLWPQPRVIHIKNAPPKGEPTRFGYSIGRWEGEELIVETDNFIPEVWGLYTGVDSSAEKTLRERYWLSEGGKRLNVEVTVSDPVYLTRVHIFTHQWEKIQDREVIKAECSVETANYYLTAGYENDNGPSAGTDAANTPDQADNATDADTGAMKYILGIAVIALGVFGVALFQTRKKNPGGQNKTPPNTPQDQ